MRKRRPSGDEEGEKTNHAYEHQIKNRRPPPSEEDQGRTNEEEEEQPWQTDPPILPCRLEFGEATAVAMSETTWTSRRGRRRRWRPPPWPWSSSSLPLLLLCSLLLLLLALSPSAEAIRCYVCGGMSGRPCEPIREPGRRSPYVRPSPVPAADGSRQWEVCNDLINNRGCIKQVVNDGEYSSLG